MIVDERLVTYINSLDRGNTPVLDEIEKEALRDFVPIIRKEMQSFLKLLLAMQKPMRILEVGTAVGFSAVLMAEYAPKDCQIVTIDIDGKRMVTQILRVRNICSHRAGNASIDRPIILNLLRRTNICLQLR